MHMTRTVRVSTLTGKIILYSLLLVSPFVHAQQPPCSSPEHRQFDFWLGDWQVVDRSGKKVGENRIESILSGCVVFENWQSAGGNFAGKSFNTFDAVAGTWNQVWVDSVGSTIHFSGTRSGNVMAMTGDQVTADGKVYYKMSYTLMDDESVRQLWEMSKDRQDWSTIFDGIYHRKK